MASLASVAVDGDRFPVIADRHNIADDRGLRTAEPFEIAEARFGADQYKRRAQGFRRPFTTSLMTLLRHRRLRSMTHDHRSGVSSNRGGATPDLCEMAPKTRKATLPGRLRRYRKNRWLRGIATPDFLRLAERQIPSLLRIEASSLELRGIAANAFNLSHSASVGRCAQFLHIGLRRRD
jgi:hypothetical protein